MKSVKFACLCASAGEMTIEQLQARYDILHIAFLYMHEYNCVRRQMMGGQLVKQTVQYTAYVYKHYSYPSRSLCLG